MIAALVIVAILALIAIPSYVAVQRRTDRISQATKLSAVAVRARQFSVDTHYRYPADLLARLNAYDPAWGSGPSTGPEHISVAVLDDRRLVAAVRTGDGSCAVLADDLAGDTYLWAYDPDAVDCDAAVAAGHFGEITGTNPGNAPTIDFG